MEISLVACLDMILSNKQITKALMGLRRCAGWSAPLVFAKTGFTCQGPYEHVTEYNGGSVVECSTQDGGVTGLSLTGGTAVCP